MVDIAGGIVLGFVAICLLGIGLVLAVVLSAKSLVLISEFPERLRNLSKRRPATLLGKIQAIVVASALVVVLGGMLLEGLTH